jgi:mono/diheme cytochrome c family protein
MKRSKNSLFLLSVLAILALVSAILLVRRGFRAASEPSAFETVLARAVRNVAIPRRERNARNPITANLTNLNEAREHFMARCSICHGSDGRGRTQMARSLYPRVPDLFSPQTQNLTHGEIHYIIANGVQLTGMPAWSSPHQETEDDSWKLVLFIRALRPLTEDEKSREIQTSDSAHYVGSKTCEKCHAQIYEHRRRTPMANVVRDPHEHLCRIQDIPPRGTFDVRRT